MLRHEHEHEQEQEEEEEGMNMSGFLRGQAEAELRPC